MVIYLSLKSFKVPIGIDIIFNFFVRSFVSNFLFKTKLFKVFKTHLPDTTSKVNKSISSISSTQSFVTSRQSETSFVYEGAQIQMKEILTRST